MLYSAPTTGVAVGSGLAFTGMNTLGLVVAAASLLCSGFALLRIARRVPKAR